MIDGCVRIRLDLAADAGDAHVDRAVERVRVARIGEVEQPLAREHALGIVGERLEQRELGRRERVLVAVVVAQQVRVEVEPLGAEAHRACGFGLRVRGGGAACGAAWLRRSTERMRATSSRSSHGLAM